MPADPRHRSGRAACYRCKGTALAIGWETFDAIAGVIVGCVWCRDCGGRSLYFGPGTPAEVIGAQIALEFGG